MEFFTRKLSLSSQKYGVGIRDLETKFVPDPGVKKAPDPNPQYWFLVRFWIRLPTSYYGT
jgi:hypothetical protein